MFASFSRSARMVNEETPASNFPDPTFWVGGSNAAVLHSVVRPSLAATASNRSTSKPMTVLPSVSRYSFGGYVESVPIEMTPSLLMSAGTLLASALSTDDFVSTWSLPPPDELPPHATVNARSATRLLTPAARRGVRITLNLPEGGVLDHPASRGPSG